MVEINCKLSSGIYTLGVTEKKRLTCIVTLKLTWLSPSPLSAIIFRHCPTWAIFHPCLDWTANGLHSSHLELFVFNLFSPLFVPHLGLFVCTTGHYTSCVCVFSRGGGVLCTICLWKCRLCLEHAYWIDHYHYLWSLQCWSDHKVS